jgi:hypothetical protein
VALRASWLALLALAVLPLVFAWFRWTQLTALAISRVSVVLPASGCEMIANVRGRKISSVRLRWPTDLLAGAGLRRREFVPV